MQLIPPAVGMAAFLTAIIVSRILQERALRSLTTEEKGRLVEAFSGMRLFALVPLAALAGIYFVVMGIDAQTTATLLTIYVPTALLVAICMQAVIHRKLHKLQVHADYLRAYTIGRVLVLAGFVLFFLSM
jgi:branched-subunit amino acid transport protein